MDKLKLITQRPTHVSAVMIVLAAILLLDLFYQTGMHIVWRRWMPATLAAPAATTQPATTQPSATQPTATQQADKTRKKNKKVKQKPISEVITRRDIFTKPKSKGHGVKLTGVAFNTAMFQTRSGKTIAIEKGQSSQGIKVVTIKDYEVTIEYKGKTEVMTLFSGSATECWSAGDARAAGPSRRSPKAIRGPGGDVQPQAPHELAVPESAKHAEIRELSGRRARMIQRRQGLTIEVGSSPQTQEAQ